MPAHGERIDEILRNADLALYRSKGEGRNCFQIYSEQMKAEADRRSALEIDLREAIWGDQLEVHYQPVVDIVSDAWCPSKRSHAGTTRRGAHPAVGIHPGR